MSALSAPSRRTPPSPGTPDALWLDLGEPGDLVKPKGPHEQWQDHGLGLLRTILRDRGIETGVASVRAVTSWGKLAGQMKGCRTLLMNVRSHAFPAAVRAARMFKDLNPGGRVLVGGIHAVVAPREMEAVAAFDRICRGPGEGVIEDLVREPDRFPRVFQGRGPRSMAEWPRIDRTLWPRPAGSRLRRLSPWPLEPPCGWGPGPVATILTSRACPWSCAFCNERSYLPAMSRRPVESVVGELNDLDRLYGVGSVVIHDSMFFQNPPWLREWLDRYPRLANRPWPYWASARPDTIRRWPDLFEALVRKTNWRTISIGFESGSDRILRLLNKETTEEDNLFSIDLVNRLGDRMEREGREPPKIWANVMLGIPGETREDAFQTMRMLRRIRRALPTPSFFSPAPGSALGAQLIAEGKSRTASDPCRRDPDEEKVDGVDYRFYRALLSGRHEAEIRREPDRSAASGEGRAVTEPGEARIPPAGKGRPLRHHWYLFPMKNGKHKLAYGRSPEDALDMLRIRLSDREMAGILPRGVAPVSPGRLQEHLDQLG